jgi:hypothetical protein
MMSLKFPALFGITRNEIRIYVWWTGTMGMKVIYIQMTIIEEWETDKFYLTKLSTAKII